MCSSTPSYTPPKQVEAPPAPPPPAETAKMDSVAKVDTTDRTGAKKKQGRSSLRIQRQTGVAGATGAGVSLAG